MKEPRRDAPFSLLVGIGAATLLYVLIQAVCIGTLPELATSKRPLADAAARFLGSAGGAFIAIGAAVSSFGTLGGTMLAAPRLLFAMAEHGQLPKGLARPHARFHTPHAGIVIVTTGAVALAWSGTFTYLLGLNVITRLVQYLAGALAVFALRRKEAADPAPFTLRGAAVIVPFTVIACVWLIARSSAKELRDAGIAFGVGLLFYAIWAASHRIEAAKMGAGR